MDNLKHLSSIAIYPFYNTNKNSLQPNVQNEIDYVSKDIVAAEVTREKIVVVPYENSENVDEIYDNLVKNDKIVESPEPENSYETHKSTENMKPKKPTESKLIVPISVISMDFNKVEAATNQSIQSGITKVKRRRGACLYKNLFLCKFCDQAYIEEQQCQDHEILEHDPGTPFFCRQCGGLFAERTSLIRHYKHAHNNDRAYQCMACEKAFVRRAELRKHSIIHTGVAPFKCSFCLKSFTRNTNLSKHLRIHSGEKPHSCSECSKSFIFRADLQRHLYTHSKIKPYSCKICGTCYARKDKLTQHENKHYEVENQGGEDKYINLVNLGLDENVLKSENSEDAEMTIDLHPLDVSDDKALRARKPKLIRDIQCEHCPKKFYANDLYMSHLTTHTGENNFICSTCPKSFPHKWQLERHKLIHEIIKPLICAYCNKGFGRKDKLNSHIKNHTK